MLTKICTKCGKELPATLDYFSSRKRNKDGLHELCKVCRTARDKQYRQEHIERYHATTKEWKEANKEHIEATNKKYAESHRDRHKETNKQWYIRNKPKKDAYVKRWARENKEQRNKTIKAWREQNKDAYVKILKRYRERNPDKNAIWAERRRAKMKNLPATLTDEQWESVKSLFEYKCAYCGVKTKLTQEHIIPVSVGGGYTADNIIPACKSCNSKKRAQPFSEWYPEQEFYNKNREELILRVVMSDAI